MRKQLIALAILLLVAGCRKDAPPQATETAAVVPEEAPAVMSELDLPQSLKEKTEEPFTGDLDAMIQRRIIRVGVPFNRSFYFIDKGTPRGLAYEYLVLFEDVLNKKLNTGHLKVHVIALPMSREALQASLLAGKVDFLIAQVTVTPERRNVVDFTKATRSNVSEIVVTAPGTPPVTSVADLSGRTLFVRKGSTYQESLVAVNKTLEAQGKPPIDIETTAAALEDDDLMEMVNAGLIPGTVVDDYLADFWKQVFTDMVVHADVAVRTGGELAIPFRKGSPKLAAALNQFIDKYGLNTAMGAILNKKYLQSTKFAKSATSEAERKKFTALLGFFRKYGTKYDFDYLLMAAQGYQESRLDQNAKSPVGAIGVMQLMPETGKEQKVGDISKVEPNVHAGVKYMRFIRKQFFDDQPMDDLNKALFTFASYNAGPGRIRQLRGEAADRGLDPNVWFGNVERVASERIGRETVTYVSNIYKYYLAYRLIASEAERKRAAAKAVGDN